MALARVPIDGCAEPHVTAFCGQDGTSVDAPGQLRICFQLPTAICELGGRSLVIVAADGPHVTVRCSDQICRCVHQAIASTVTRPDVIQHPYDLAGDFEEPLPTLRVFAREVQVIARHPTLCAGIESDRFASTTRHPEGSVGALEKADNSSRRKGHLGGSVDFPFFLTIRVKDSLVSPDPDGPIL